MKQITISVDPTVPYVVDQFDHIVGRIATGMWTVTKGDYLWTYRIQGARKADIFVAFFLAAHHPSTYAAHIISAMTSISISAVRAALDRLRERNLVDRDLDIGLNSQTLHMWYWIG